MIKRGNVPKSSLKKSVQLKVLKDHFEEFVSAKERLEVLEAESKKLLLLLLILLNGTWIVSYGSFVYCIFNCDYILKGLIII